jgi:hypothetical protein
MPDRSDFTLEIYGPQGLRKFIRDTLILSRSAVAYEYVVCMSILYLLRLLLQHIISFFSAFIKCSSFAAIYESMSPNYIVYTEVHLRLLFLSHIHVGVNVVWVMEPSSLVGGYLCFRGMCCLLIQEVSETFIRSIRCCSHFSILPLKVTEY